MSEETIGFVMLSAVSATCAVITHWQIRGYFKASLASMLAAAVLFQCIAWMRLGYMDPFMLIAFPISLPITGAIALLVGVPFHTYRRNA